MAQTPVTPRRRVSAPPSLASRESRHEDTSCRLCTLERRSGVRECHFCRQTATADSLGLPDSHWRRAIFSRDAFADNASGLSDEGVSAAMNESFRVATCSVKNLDAFRDAMISMPDALRQSQAAKDVFTREVPQNLSLLPTDNGLLLLSHYVEETPHVGVFKAACDHLAPLLAKGPLVHGGGVCRWASGLNPAGAGCPFAAVWTLSLGAAGFPGLAGLKVEDERDATEAAVYALANSVLLPTGVLGVRLIRDGDILMAIVGTSNMAAAATPFLPLHVPGAAAPRLIGKGPIVWRRHVPHAAARRSFARGDSTHFSLSLAPAKLDHHRVQQHDGDGDGDGDDDEQASRTRTAPPSPSLSRLAPLEETSTRASSGRVEGASRATGSDARETDRSPPQLWTMGLLAGSAVLLGLVRAGVVRG
ncbi:hypothetical protein EMIHUDRAFT_442816 [Emiliania huxleyi CCMP1516]|uniref:Uncharacterized protein n=2 Tax=Emiliania huxleyi TaxID=2903 RepID=A0A0D3K013_EMIH1|nr:hypothetical protein EMIHUDRAFT_436346 [Emiliania huxleyi CCMP1516]XP_005781527.1 hypothetical protein EMIHUDRAFT_442816 [Emiliania huxleyi CCMP1516]EOD17877.1 hypothetical protein EMIHUDRAFT_436346 [Emiliania huxleyi CCMP1516]EOD29098.1 hypothetical protein EMIHUDRAFT_442816 [Emiliania huxleyi CCMP1516]|eukprot:XP_005770306.1 hypothetical protein EMIHUDRAFT_436346 [Emiliania huxleyi CCMP1516]